MIAHANHKGFRARSFKGEGKNPLDLSLFSFQTVSHFPNPPFTPFGGFMESTPSPLVRDLVVPILSHPLPAQDEPVIAQTLEAMGVALEEEQDFQLIEDEEGHPKVEICSGWSHWGWNQISSSFSEERNEKVAQFLLPIVKNRQSHSIKDNAHDYGLEVSKRFLKTLASASSQPSVKELRTELIAARLGVTSTVIEANAGFENFAKKAHLYRYLQAFDHCLGYNPQTLEVHLKEKGELRPWSQIQGQVQWDEFEEWKGYYGEDGLRWNSPYEWEELCHFKTEDPQKWNHKYIFEFVVWTLERYNLKTRTLEVPEDPQFTNTHTHIRLRSPSPTNNVYSVGFYRPLKRSLLDNFRSPLSVRKGIFSSPDSTEFWGGRRTVIPIEITEEAFEKIKEAIREDHSTLTEYQLTHRNCNEWACKLARIAGVNLTPHLPVIRMFLSGKAALWTQETLETLPKALQSLLLRTSTVAFNSLLYTLGAGSLHSSIPQALPSAQHVRPLLSRRTLFDPSHTRISHPHALERWMTAVGTWREETRRLIETRIHSLYTYLTLAQHTLSEEKKREIKQQIQSLQKEKELVQHALPESPTAPPTP